MNIGKFSKLVSSYNVKYAFLRGEDDRRLKKYQTKKAIKEFKKRKIKYSSSKGDTKLINLITKKENVNKENVIIVNGSTYGVFSFFLLMNEEDKVMIFRPYYPLYKELCIMLKRKVSFADLSINNFNLTYDFFIDNLKDDIKYVIINNPHNPTGKVYDNEEIRKIIRYCEDNKIYVLLDSVYEKLVYENNDFIKYNNENHIIHLKSFSKSYNMTGVRIGYIVSSKSIIKKINSYISNTLISTPLMIQKIAYSSLKKDRVYVLKRYKKNREIVKQFLIKNNLDYVSLDGTYYVFIKIDKFNMTSYEFVLDLINKKKVAVLPGFLFGEDKYIRLSYMKNTRYLKNGLKRITDYLKENNQIV